jgi:hypothetical protein
LLTLGLIVLLRPWLARYAMGAAELPLVPPRADAAGRRHRGRSPRCPGVACGRAGSGVEFLPVSAATALLTVVGARDDLRSLPATVRLAMQCVAVGTVIADSRANCKWCRRCLGGSNAQAFFSVGCGSSTSSISWTASIG